MHELKPLSPDGIEAALEKAKRYRLLNEPLEAESICRDILRVEPEHQEALIWLALSLTDQFGAGRAALLEEARQIVQALADPYHRTYYNGIIAERRGKARLDAGGPRSGFDAYHWFAEAMRYYDEAEKIRPEGNDDAILRWNTCARIMNDHPDVRLEPEGEREIAMLE